MDKELIEKDLIPLDKSWMIRVGILDMLNHKSDILTFLNSQKNLSDDLLALKRTVETWDTDEPIDVGESGTLYRILKFISWKLNLNKKFIIKGTLKEREITDDKSIILLPLKALLKLDNGTSQWATASILMGNRERIENVPYKLNITYEALEHWNEQRQANAVWEPRYDSTILNQALVFIELLKGKKPVFVLEQSEDYCFAYAFGYITAPEGEKMWPSLRSHESDRIEEMTVQLSNAQSGKDITAKDHRVVQAIAMWGKLNKKEVNILNKNAVNKSWPQFWEFLEESSMFV